MINNAQMVPNSDLRELTLDEVKAVSGGAVANHPPATCDCCGRLLINCPS
jgi:hypothetical protein